MNLRKLIQPRHPAFWLMLVVNGLSALLAWVLRSQTLSPALSLLIGGFALGNAVLGLWLLRVLLR